MIDKGLGLGLVLVLGLGLDLRLFTVLWSGLCAELIKARYSLRHSPHSAVMIPNGPNPHVAGTI